MVSLETLEVIAGVAVAGIMALAHFLEKRIDHGEARFGPDGKVIEDDNSEG